MAIPFVLLVVILCFITMIGAKQENVIYSIWIVLLSIYTTCFRGVDRENYYYYFDFVKTIP